MRIRAVLRADPERTISYEAKNTKAKKKRAPGLSFFVFEALAGMLPASREIYLLNQIADRAVGHAGEARLEAVFRIT
jgi:hypothetical protein